MTRDVDRGVHRRPIKRRSRDAVLRSDLQHVVLAVERGLPPSVDERLDDLDAAVQHAPTTLLVQPHVKRPTIEDVVGHGGAVVLESGREQLVVGLCAGVICGHDGSLSDH